MNWYGAPEPEPRYSITLNKHRYRVVPLTNACFRFERHGLFLIEPHGKLDRIAYDTRFLDGTFDFTYLWETELRAKGRAA